MTKSLTLLFVGLLCAGGGSELFMRGHEEVTLGTVLGNNIFNGLFVVGLVAVLSSVPLAFASVDAGLATSKSSILDRRRGALLLALYIVYTAVLLQQQPAGPGGH